MKLSHRKRAYKADAIQWDGTNTEVVFDAYPGAELFGSRHIMVRHAEGISTLNIGDWVVRGENGETLKPVMGMRVARHKPETQT